MGTSGVKYLDPVAAFDAAINYTSQVNAKKLSIAKTIFVKKPEQFGLALAAIILGILAVVREIFVALGGLFPLIAKAMMHVVRTIRNSPVGDKTYHKLPGLRNAVEQIKKIVAQIFGIVISIIGLVTTCYKGSRWNVEAQTILGNCILSKSFKATRTLHKVAIQRASQMPKSVQQKKKSPKPVAGRSEKPKPLQQIQTKLLQQKGNPAPAAATKSAPPKPKPLPVKPSPAATQSTPPKPSPLPVKPNPAATQPVPPKPRPLPAISASKRTDHRNPDPSPKEKNPLSKSGELKIPASHIGPSIIPPPPPPPPSDSLISPRISSNFKNKGKKVVAPTAGEDQTELLKRAFTRSRTAIAPSEAETVNDSILKRTPLGPIVSGGMSIKRFNELFAIKLEDDWGGSEGDMTLNDFLYQQKGQICPPEGTIIHYQEAKFHIVKIFNGKILEILVKIPKEEL